MTLIRDLIDIPTEVRAGDFVLKLTDSVTGDHAADTVASYAVTPQLGDAFTRALGLVAGAVESGESQATYLHGSFGSGKSHFMAVLHLLLRQHPAARAKQGLHEAIATHGDRIAGKQFLQVPVHFLGARSMEQKILGGYVEHVQRLHPGAPLPAVYLGDTIVAEELPRLRARFGDHAFLAGLNGADGGADAGSGPGAGDADAWGEFAPAWTAPRLERALAAPATDPERGALVHAYIAAFRPATTTEALSTGEGFVDLPHGLAAASAHAQQLGYDGIVLFLDELILWLASNIGNLDLVQRESQKLTNLVESSAAPRPVPVVSFVARQRDLRDLVGDNVTGAEQAGFADNLQLQQGRVEKIVLEDANLPLVARRRILVPVDDAAEQQLRGAVEQALGDRDDVRDVLQGQAADVELFRTVYPFSPSLVNALVDVAEALQRERTALKVMLQLLVDRRDDLALGDVIPVGDLWDVVVEQDRPSSPQMATLFERAKTLHRTKLRPMLLDGYELDGSTPPDAPAWRAFHNDERLLKTLLLAALVPEVEAFRNLDAARLHALNWGSTLVAPVPGSEAELVARKLRQWNSEVGELRVGDDPVNPTVSLGLVDVDSEAVVDRARYAFDNPGARRRAVRALVDEALDERLGTDLDGTFRLEWRGTDRAVDVTLVNVRDTRQVLDDTLRASGDRPKVVVDLPFDDGGGSPEDDQLRLDEWTAANRPTLTACWLPTFITARGLTGLGRYVALDELLRSETRLDQHTQHLSQQQRAQLRPILTNMRGQLHDQLRDALVHAYGLRAEPHPWVANGTSPGGHLRSLDPALDLRPPTQPGLLGALQEIADQLLAHQHPGHPRFDSKVTPAKLQTTWEEIQRALATADRRVLVERSRRAAVATVVTGLGLGNMGESWLHLTGDWANRLDRPLAEAREKRRPVTVADVRAWIDGLDGRSRGLPPNVADLVVRTVAAQTDHSLLHGGLPVADDARRALDARTVLHPEELPEPAVWQQAVATAQRVLGIDQPGPLSGAGLAEVATQVRARVAGLREPAARLVPALETAHRHAGRDDGRRLRTARVARDLVDRLAGADNLGVVAALAELEAPTTEQALGRSLATAAAVADALDDTNWRLLTHVARDMVAADLAAVLDADELERSYDPRRRELERKATAAIEPPVEPKPPPPPIEDETVTDGTGAGTADIRSTDDLDHTVERLRRAFAAHGPLTASWRPGGTGR